MASQRVSSVMVARPRTTRLLNTVLWMFQSYPPPLKRHFLGGAWIPTAMDVTSLPKNRQVSGLLVAERTKAVHRQRPGATLKPASTFWDIPGGPGRSRLDSRRSNQWPSVPCRRYSHSQLQRSFNTRRQVGTPTRPINLTSDTGTARDGLSTHLRRRRHRSQLTVPRSSGPG